MGETKLKPCPFCGGEAIMRDNKLGCTIWIVGCRKCGADAGFRTDKEEAIKAWNTRVGDSNG
jgi:Lar family restriction alleviation protein